MAHPGGSELSSRTSTAQGFSDKAQLLGQDAIFAKQRMMEEDAIEIGLLNDEKVPKCGDTLFFQDGKRPIDFVLAFETPASEEDLKEEEKEEQAELAGKRKVFEGNLIKAGLELEYEDEVSTKGDKTKTQFVKIHAPWEVLLQTAEDMKMKMPIKESDIETKTWYERHVGQSIRQTIEDKNPLIIHDGCIPTSCQYFMAYFKKDKVGDFVGSHDHNSFFSRPERSRMVEHLCSKQKFSEDAEHDGHFDIGIKKLVFDGGYTSAYALHSGGEETPEGQSPVNNRQKLRRDWARFGRLIKFQPYDAIKEYFGTEIGLYFAWLGFYTAMLVPAALFGLVVFIYGISHAADFTPVQDICNKDEFYMCPLCDKQCPYWSLKSSCYYAMVVHAFDNDATVYFAIFMSIWATLFLEFWKRRQAVLAYRWHVMHYEEMEEVIRPEFVATAPTWRQDPVTGERVPHIPKMTRYQRFAGIGSAVSFMIMLVLAAVIGVVVYRAAVYLSLASSSDSDSLGSYRIEYAKNITTVTAALINLVCINLLKFFYQKLALWLTNWENPRTDTDYKDSFTYKMYIFQFVNNYSSIFYIAFFKIDLMIGTPGHYRRFAGWRLDGCGAGGCLMDLCIQLAVIMVGQQIINNITEVVIPGLMKWWKLRQAAKEHVDLPQWEADYKLSPLPEHNLFWEYLEIVLQFGFVTMFVAAFPLAPLFALLNNIFEVRVDAINFICQFRRPAPQRAQDIGAWSRIMEGLASLSVLVNAFVIAFTSDFIPRLVYVYSVSEDGSFNGYVNNSLSYFNVSDFEEEPDERFAYTVLNYTSSHCRYFGWRESQKPYNVTKQYWQVIAGRLAFVFLFQFVVYGITRFVSFIIPDRPKILDLKVKREEFLAKEALQERPLVIDENPVV